VKRDHHPVVSLADFDRAALERTPRVAPRKIEFEDSLDDQYRENNPGSYEARSPLDQDQLH